MNRRNFLKAFTGAAVGAGVLAYVPITAAAPIRECYDFSAPIFAPIWNEIKDWPEAEIFTDFDHDHNVFMLWRTINEKSTLFALHLGTGCWSTPITLR